MSALDAALASAMDEAAHCTGALLAARLYASINPSAALDAMMDAAARAGAIHSALILATAEMQADITAKLAACQGEPTERRADA